LSNKSLAPLQPGSAAVGSAWQHVSILQDR